jgi:hypothetical protein
MVFEARDGDRRNGFVPFLFGQEHGDVTKEYLYPLLTREMLDDDRFALLVILVASTHVFPGESKDDIYKRMAADSLRFFEFRNGSSPQDDERERYYSGALRLMTEASKVCSSSVENDIDLVTGFEEKINLILQEDPNLDRAGMDCARDYMLELINFARNTQDKFALPITVAA